MEFVFKTKIVGNHGNKLTIRGLSTIILDSVSKVRIECIHIASIPRDLDGVADGALDAACGGLVFLCDARIQYLRDAVDYVRILDGQKNRRAKILIPLDMRGNAYLMYYLRHLSFYI